MAKKKDTEGGDEDEKKGGLGGKLKLVALILPTVLLIVGAVYFLVLAPKSSAAASKTATGTSAAAAATAASSGSTVLSDGIDITDPLVQATFQAGNVLDVPAVTVNLSNGHYLKVGLGLQEIAGLANDVSPDPAVDCLITEFSGKTVDQLATQQARDAAKVDLERMVYKVYDKQVYKVFYNSFVMN